MRTEHFYVHFPPPLEPLARRAATEAERAWALLAAELVPPRGAIDLVVADNVDFTNGLATTFPTNRIIIYAHPPVGGRSLRFFDDWIALVIAHELTHLFHLDRATGIWGVGQRILGRHPWLFPNQYQPAWIAEGLAVYYESRLTGSGRIHGSEHYTVVRAAVAEDRLMRLDQLSLGSSTFPGGTSAYAVGSLLFDHLARTRGAAGVGEFVERSSRQIIPFRLDRVARQSFGVSFHRAWREWRDSLERVVGDVRDPIAGYRELTGHGWFALHPRWRTDSALVYAASTGREVAGAYEVTVDGRRRRLGRRNSLEPNVPLGGDSLLFAQLEFRSPYELRSDLFIDDGDTERRLTDGARLTVPDVREDGTIVAAQATPGSTRLVLVSPDGAITPLTRSHPDTMWTEPRWSPRGDRIAAVRWSRGGRTAIAVLDTLGATTRIVIESRAINATPAWTPDGAAIVFSSDAGGAADLHLALLDDPPGEGTPAIRRLSDAATGLLQPAVSPDGARLASVLYRADGYHIGLSPFGAARDIARQAADSSVLPATVATAPSVERVRPPMAAPASFEGPVRRYSPWRQLVPRYWMPVFIFANPEPDQFGFTTSGSDIVGRHSYWMGATTAAGFDAYDVEGVYRYAGLGLPVLELYALRTVEAPDTSLFGAAAPFFRRETSGSLAATFLRRRVRTMASAQLGLEAEHFEFRTDPDSVLLGRGGFRSADRRTVFVRGGWSNARTPPLAISPENGIAASAIVRQRWLVNRGRSDSRSVAAVLRGYRALDLGGFAHHVLAARLAGGLADARTTSAFEVGGVLGAPLSVLPGYSLGEGGAEFGVRGFPREAQLGTRALAGSLEYRLPLFVAGRGIRFLPLFFDRTSLTLFGDAGSAWCEGADEGPFFCTERSATRRWLAAVGGELNLDAALLQYDRPYRLRGGVAVPVAGRAYTSRTVSAYLTLGLSF